MKTRLSFGLLAGLLMIALVVGLFPSLQTLSAAVAASATPTPSPAPTATLLPYVPFPTRVLLAQSPTSIPLRPTYTSIPGETPEMVDTPTLLPINTATLLPVDTQAPPIPTQTLIFFATITLTPNGGTATPPVAVAYVLDAGKAETCYKGPSLAYIEIDTFQIARIVGKDLTGKWWYLLVFKDPQTYFSCWVSGDKVTTGGNLSSLSVTEPELPQITQVKVSIPAESLTIACDAGATKTTLHFSGQISTNGPIDQVGYAWVTDAPAYLAPGRAPVKAWNAPAQVEVDLAVPSQAGTYSLSLRTTFPMEILGELRFMVKCK